MSIRNHNFSSFIPCQCHSETNPQSLPIPRQELAATNAQFSLLQSSLTLFPTILPLIGGIFVERFGAGPSSIAFSSFILVGQILVLMSTWTGNVNGMVGGFMIFGYVSRDGRGEEIKGVTLDKNDSDVDIDWNHPMPEVECPEHTKSLFCLAWQSLPKSLRIAFFFFPSPSYCNTLFHYYYSSPSLQYWRRSNQHSSRNHLD